jgi:hypothetical protein
MANPSRIHAFRQDNYSNGIRGGYAGKNMHSDRYVLSRIAKYYLQRSALTPDQQRALGASVLLSGIEDLRNSSPELQKIFEAESGPRE